MDVVTLHRHNEVDIKNINEDVAVSLVHDDDTLGATQIIDILSKLYRATFGCWIFHHFILLRQCDDYVQ